MVIRASSLAGVQISALKLLPCHMKKPVARRLKIAISERLH